MNKKSTITPGLTLLIMVFVILCMTIFSLLYFIEAKRAYEQSINSYQKIDEYYKADNEFRKRYDEYLIKQSQGILEYQTGDIINLEIAINDTQYLKANLEVGDGTIKIVSYKRVVENEMGY